MEIIEYLNGSLVAVHNMMNIALQDLTPEVAQWQPTGTANTIAQLLAHMVGAEDRAINVSIKGGTTLGETWGAKTGIPQERGGHWRKDWALNIDAFTDYTKAVQASAAECLAALTPADLDKEVQWFNGPNSTGGLIRMVVFNHPLLHSGEISALKGMQGLKGLPM
jgi:hypothetical protein